MVPSSGFEELVTTAAPSKTAQRAAAPGLGSLMPATPGIASGRAAARSTTSSRMESQAHLQQAKLGQAGASPRGGQDSSATRPPDTPPHALHGWRGAREVANSRLPSGTPALAAGATRAGLRGRSTRANGKNVPVHLRRAAWQAVDGSDSSFSDSDHDPQPLPRRPLPRRQMLSPEETSLKANKTNFLWDEAELNKLGVTAVGDHARSHSFAVDSEDSWDGLQPEPCSARPSDALDSPGRAAVDSPAKLKSSPEKAEEGQGTAAWHAVEAVCAVIHEMLQVKYGLMLDEPDLVRKVAANCGSKPCELRSDAGDADGAAGVGSNGCNTGSAAIAPARILTRLNEQHNLQFRTRDGRSLITLRVDANTVGTYSDLLCNVRKMPGTARSVALIRPTQSQQKRNSLPYAVAVFREDYGQRNLLVARAYDADAEPLLAFRDSDFCSAIVLDPEVTRELYFSPSSGELLERPAPRLREEYASLALGQFHELPHHAGREQVSTSNLRSRPLPPSDTEKQSNWLDLDAMLKDTAGGAEQLLEVCKDQWAKLGTLLENPSEPSGGGVSQRPLAAHLLAPHTELRGPQLPPQTPTQMLRAPALLQTPTLLSVGLPPAPTAAFAPSGHYLPPGVSGGPGMPFPAHPGYGVSSMVAYAPAGMYVAGLGD